LACCEFRCGWSWSEPMHGGCEIGLGMNCFLNCLLTTEAASAFGFYIDEIEIEISTRKSGVGVFTQPGPTTDVGPVLRLRPIVLPFSLAASSQSARLKRRTRESYATARVHYYSSLWCGGGVAACGARARAEPRAADRRIDELCGERSGRSGPDRGVSGEPGQPRLDRRPQYKR